MAGQDGTSQLTLCQEGEVGLVQWNQQTVKARPECQMLVSYLAVSIIKAPVGRSRDASQAVALGDTSY